MDPLDLSESQRAALSACVRDGQLHRTRAGYAGRTVGVWFNTRTVYALQRAGLIEIAEGTTVAKATDAGRDCARNLHVKQQPSALRA